MQLLYNQKIITWLSTISDTLVQNCHYSDLTIYTSAFYIYYILKIHELEAVEEETKIIIFII